MRRWILYSILCTVCSAVADEAETAKEESTPGEDRQTAVGTAPPASGGRETPIRVLWRKAPVPIELPVGKERFVTFPEPVRVGVPPVLSGKLRTQSAAGVVYWRAGEAFGPYRVQVQGLESGTLWLIDLSASESAPGDPVELIDPSADTRSNDEKPASRERKQPPQLDYVELTRLAAHRLYAPKRFWQTPPGVRRVAVNRKPVPNLIRSLESERLKAVPAASWRSGRLTVTAVRLRNLTPRAVELDPRRLRGRWLAATFQHARLHPAGTVGDETAVYLISDQPFEEVTP